MEDHRLAVAAELDVELDSLPLGHRRGDGSAAILDQGAAVEAAMGEACRTGIERVRI